MWKDAFVDPNPGGADNDTDLGGESESDGVPGSPCVSPTEPRLFLSFHRNESLSEGEGTPRPYGPPLVTQVDEDTPLYSPPTPTYESTEALLNPHRLLSGESVHTPSHVQTPRPGTIYTYTETRAPQEDAHVQTQSLPY